MRLHDMTKLKVLLITSVIAAAPLYASAAGVGTDAAAGVTGGVTGSAAGTTAGATSSGQASVAVTPGTPADIGAAVTAAGEAGATVDELKADAKFKNIRIIKLDSSANSNAELSAAMSSNHAQMANVRSALEANADVRAALEANNITADSVIAADVSGEGDLTIYAGG
jgi:hypothetical protein